MSNPFPFRQKHLTMEIKSQLNSEEKDSLVNYLTRSIEKQSKEFLTGSFYSEFSVNKSGVKSDVLNYETIKDMLETSSRLRRYGFNIMPWEVGNFYPNTEKAKLAEEWEKIKPHIGIEKEKWSTYTWTDITHITHISSSHLNNVINMTGSIT